MTERVGVILAGGESRRFGSPKAFALYRGLPLYEHVKHVLTPFVNEVIVISHPELVEQFEQDLDVRVFQDLEAFQGKGPLAGILTALTLTTADDYLVFSCDVPLISAEYIRWLIHQGEVFSNSNGVIPIENELLHPMMGLYRRSVRDYLKELLDSNQLRVKHLIDKANIPCLPVDSRIPPTTFYNINFLDQLQELNQS